MISEVIFRTVAGTLFKVNLYGGHHWQVWVPESGSWKSIHNGAVADEAIMDLEDLETKLAAPSK